MTTRVSDTDRYLFDLRGYLVVPNVLDPDRLRALHAELDGVDRHSGQEREDALRWLPALGPAFTDLIDHPRLLPYLVEFVDEAVRLDHAYAIVMKPGDPGLPLHGFVDDRPRNCAWYDVRGGVISAGLTVVSFALTDVAAASGGFVCVPGSHKANFRSPYLDQLADPNRPEVAHVEVRAGDAVIFTEALTHGSLDWVGPGDRRALFYKYAPRHAAWLSHAWSSEELAALTPRQREIVSAPGIVDSASGRERAAVTLDGDR